MNVRILEPIPKLVAMRREYFPSEFWDKWENLGPEKEVYLMGWLAELDYSITVLERKLAALTEGSNHEGNHH